MRVPEHDDPIPIKPLGLVWGYKTSGDSLAMDLVLLRKSMFFAERIFTLYLEQSVSWIDQTSKYFVICM